MCCGRRCHALIEFESASQSSMADPRKRFRFDYFFFACSGIFHKVRVGKVAWHYLANVHALDVRLGLRKGFQSFFFACIGRPASSQKGFPIVFLDFFCCCCCFFPLKTEGNMGRAVRPCFANVHCTFDFNLLFF